ncbi:HU family DNA-binding protein [Butyrivibrio sp. INlla21]|uniref:HU family DNA-binding protein n=1 Tax=Butyrivibrio sp. INlla21 TaxID=1520811 RepID=UPI0008EBC3DC|nr:HU family DNA-binding protein [Butyrivibrio sp. INlla21]SFU36568.1 nucleoid DNA-binding protein [Butyrivibrio sp. INlla21]
MEVMNRSEFIREISLRSNVEVEDVQKVIEAGEDILMNSFREGEAVRPFYGITLKPRPVKDGEYLNPKTLDIVEVKNRKTIGILLSTTFKQKLNGTG